MNKTHIIIGSSAAGIGVANALRQVDPLATIICISDEQESPYNKCMLADYVAGAKPQEQVYTLTPEKAAAKNITVLLAKRVVRIIPDEQCIVVGDGSRLAYDTLFIGTGTSPVVPALAGINDCRGIFTFHTLRDSNGMLSYKDQYAVRKAVVIGSGLSGLECADSLAAHTISVSVVEMGNQVLRSLVTPQGSLVIEQAMTHQGITLYTNETVVEVLHADNRVTGVRLASGKHLEADILIIAVGVRPNVALAQQAGIVLGETGIMTDEHMRTSIPTIYAGGDVAMVKDQLTGEYVQSRTWPDAMFQGLVAAHSMAGKHKTYPGVATVTSSAFFGLKIAACGVLNPSSLQECLVNVGNGSHHTYILEQGLLKGFSLIGDTAHVGMLKRALLTGQQVSREQLCGGF